jgi:phage terminase large subunit-like protein
MCGATGRRSARSRTAPKWCSPDGSYNRDSTILVGATVEERPHIFLIEAWEKPLLHAGRWRVRRNDVLAAIEAALARFDVVEFAPDPPGWIREIEDLEEEYGEVVVRFETKQTSRMAPAIDDFEQGVHDGTLTHDGSEVIARHLSNVVPVVDKLGKVVAIRKEDPDSPNKIDAAVGAVVAYHRARWHFAHGSDDVGAFVIDLSPKKREAA